MEIEHSNRARVKVLVSALPGLHLRQLQRILGLSFNSTRYHVEGLTKTGEIVRADEGGYSRLYPTGMKPSDKVVYPLTRKPSDRKILKCLTENGSLSHRQLSEVTGLAKSTISEHLARLVEADVVRTSQNSQGLLVFGLADPDQIRGILSAGDETLLRKAAKEFVDLWDF